MGEQLRLAPGGHLPAGGYGLEPLHCEALALIVICKLLYILGHNALVVLGLAAKVPGLVPGIGVQLALLDLIIKPVGVVHIVQIAIVLPPAVGIGGAGVVLELAVDLVLGEDGRAFQKGVNQHHDYRHHYSDRDKAVDKSFKNVFCHNIIYFFILSSAICFLLEISYI